MMVILEKKNQDDKNYIKKPNTNHTNQYNKKK